MPSSSRALVHPKDEIMQTMERIYRYRMTTTSGGNLSIRDSSGAIWITPARLDKGNLTREDVVCVLPNGSVEGKHAPSSEFPFHRAIYRVRPDLRSIVHAHPVALVAFSICHRVPDTRLFPQAYWMSGRVGFARYALPGSERLGESIACEFERGCDSVILENHGVVVGGQGLAHAFQRFEALEFACKTLIKASQIGTVRCLEDEALGWAQQRKHQLIEECPGDPTPREQELRRQIVEFLRRGCRQRLLISTEGSFSARLSDESFLITPSQQDRERLRIDDLVLVQGDRCEPGLLPSRATLQHRAIYQRHPHVQAIVFAHPVNATAFSVTATELDARTIPESYLFLRDVQRIPFGVQYGIGSPPIEERLGIDRPVGLVENDGVVVVGRSVLDAFDRLEVLETTAEAIINARGVGPIAPMPDAAIEELRQAFRM